MPESFSSAAEKELRRALARPAGASGSLPDSPTDQKGWGFTPLPEPSSNSGLRPAPLRTQQQTQHQHQHQHQQQYQHQPWPPTAGSLPLATSTNSSSPSSAMLSVHAANPGFGLRRSLSATELRKKRPGGSGGGGGGSKFGSLGTTIGNTFSSSISRSQKKALPRPPIEEEDWGMEECQARPVTGGGRASPRCRDDAAGAISIPSLVFPRGQQLPSGPPPTVPLPVIRESPYWEPSLSSSPSSLSRPTSASRPSSAPHQSSPPQQQQQQQQQHYLQQPQHHHQHQQQQQQRGAAMAMAMAKKGPRHTMQERVWLHRNYRGEAPFLRAWGLNIESEEDREEGRALMQELMQADDEFAPGPGPGPASASSSSLSSAASSTYDNRSSLSSSASAISTASSSQYSQQQHRGGGGSGSGSGSGGLLTSGGYSSNAEKAASEEGLHIILEEDTWTRLGPDSWEGGEEGGGGEEGLEGEGEREREREDWTSQQGELPLRLQLHYQPQPPPRAPSAWSTSAGVILPLSERHSRSESDGSVLHTYLKTWEPRR